MMGGAMPAPSWPSQATLQRHYRKHGSKFPYTSVQEYKDSSIETVNVGRSFAYTDPSTGDARQGYYDGASNRFTAVTADGRRIVTHFPPDRHQKYVEELPDSTYT
jgi:pyocin large subunit-like protein